MAIIHVKKRLTFQMHPPENRPNFSERYRSTVALLLSHFSALTPNSIDTSCQQQRHRQSTVHESKSIQEIDEKRLSFISFLKHLQMMLIFEIHEC